MGTGNQKTLSLYLRRCPKAGSLGATLDKAELTNQIQSDEGNCITSGNPLTSSIQNFTQYQATQVSWINVLISTSLSSIQPGVSSG